LNFAGKRFFFNIYDVIVKQKIKKRSTIHYLQFFENRFREKE